MTSVRSLVIFGPWIGEFSYEMSWWAPRIRKLRNERFPNSFAVHLGYLGREIFYRDFVDAYIPFDESTASRIGIPMCGMIFDPVSGKPKSSSPDADNFVQAWLRSHAGSYAEVTQISPGQIAEYVGEDSLGMADVFMDEPYGDFVRLEPREDILEQVRALLNFDTENDVVAVLPKLRFRNGARDSQVWAASRWQEFLERLIVEMGLNLAIIVIPMRNDQPGTMTASDLGFPPSIRKHIRFLEFDGKNAVEKQTALLKLTACSIYGATGAATLPLFANTPLFAMQTLENAWRLGLQWQKRLTDGHKKVFIYAKRPMGEEYFATPVSDVFDSFRYFYYTRVSPAAESVEALQRLQEAKQAYRSGQFELALTTFERAVTKFPLLSVTPSPSSRSAKAKAEVYFRKSVLLERDDEETSRAYYKKLRRQQMYGQPIRYFVKEPVKRHLRQLRYHFGRFLR